MTRLLRGGSFGLRRSDAPWNVACSLVLAVSAAGVSPQSQGFERELNALVGYYAIPASSSRDHKRERFERLARQWRRDTRWLSSTTQISMHPAYQEIIGMGPSALPWIVADLRSSPDHWFWALKAISGQDPVTPQDRGHVDRMKASWLRWAANRGLLAS
jgi:hypothetical protein